MLGETLPQQIYPSQNRKEGHLKETLLLPIIYLISFSFQALLPQIFKSCDTEQVFPQNFFEPPPIF